MRRTSLSFKSTPVQEYIRQVRQIGFEMEFHYEENKRNRFRCLMKNVGYIGKLVENQRLVRGQPRMVLLAVWSALRWIYVSVKMYVYVLYTKKKKKTPLFKIPCILPYLDYTYARVSQIFSLHARIYKMSVIENDRWFISFHWYHCE